MNTRILHNREPVLLVEDHSDVLLTTSAFLEAAGFDVVQAKASDEALARIAAGQRFVLLVTDFALPGLNGVDLATRALEQIPDLKVLIITGLPNDKSLCQRPPNFALLTKPFRRAALIECVESLLGTDRTITPTSPD